jgi:hypothetical protein
MVISARTKQLCLLLLLGTAACRDATGTDVCRQKISVRLLDDLSTSDAAQKKYRVVIRLSDSTGIRDVAPTIAIANNAIATGFLTAAEVRKLCVLHQVLFIDLPKQYHQLEQN